uniref:Uncharacterized protein n=1 Tax=Ditylenchus dipsaci TaxID=166011 RepID=A0A915CPS2_9BILA
MARLLRGFYNIARSSENFRPKPATDEPRPCFSSCIFSTMESANKSSTDVASADIVALTQASFNTWMAIYYPLVKVLLQKFVKRYSTTVASPTSLDAVLQRYQMLVHSGALSDDTKQKEIVTKFDSLRNRLSEQQAIPSTSPTNSFLRLLASSLKLNSYEKSVPSTPGIYLYGTVGCGKTMLMDLFYEVAPTKRKEEFIFMSLWVSFTSSCIN